MYRIGDVCIYIYVFIYIYLYIIVYIVICIYTVISIFGEADFWLSIGVKLLCR